MGFTITYTDTKYTLKLLGLSFGSFILLMILLLNFTEIIARYLGHGTFALFNILTPLLIFFSFKKRIVRSGVVEISNGILHFNLESEKQKIKIDDIKSYKIEYNQGISFKIETWDGKKRKITANRNFCNPSDLEAFVNYFETIIADSKSIGNALSRIKSDYEKKGMFYFLLFVSFLLTVGISYLLFIGGKIGGAVYIGFGALIVSWFDYFKTKRKFSKGKDFNNDYLRS